MGNRKKALFLQLQGVEHAKHNKEQFRYRCAAFYSQLKSKDGNILAKATAFPLTNLSAHIHFPLLR
jgi:hypothetical protein